MQTLQLFDIIILFLWPFLSESLFSECSTFSFFAQCFNLPYFLFFPRKYWNVNQIDIFGSSFWRISPRVTRLRILIYRSNYNLKLRKLWKKLSPTRMNLTGTSVDDLSPQLVDCSTRTAGRSSKFSFNQNTAYCI